MNNVTGKISGIVVAAALLVTIASVAWAQGPAGLPIPAPFSGPNPGNNHQMDALIGAALGGFLGYMVENNWNQDHNRPYYERDRYYNGHDRGLHRGHAYGHRNRYDRDSRYHRAPWEYDADRYPGWNPR